MVPRDEMMGWLMCNAFGVVLFGLEGRETEGPDDRPTYSD